MQRGDTLSMTGAEWRKLDPDRKTVDERGQRWLLRESNGQSKLCPVQIVTAAKLAAERPPAKPSTVR